MIKKITRAYVRHYRDNGQMTAYVEWIDGRGKAGRTEGVVGPCPCCGNRRDIVGAIELDEHMAALFRRAEREGLKIEQEIW